MTDTYSRLLLALIALLLAAIAAHDLGALPGTSGQSHAVGQRFSVVAIRAPGGPVLIRTDSVTGKVWKRNVRGEGGGWTLLEEEPSATEAARSPGSGATAPSETAASAGGKAATRVRNQPRTQEEIQGILRVIRDADPEMRVWAARQLGSVPADQALTPLTQALDDSEPRVVLAAIVSLRKIGDPGVLPRLRELTTHASPEVQAAAKGAIRALENQ